MAWPLTPLTIYNQSLPPPIKAVDLNGIQTAINSIIGNAYYLNSMTIDRVGGSAVSALNSNLFLVGSSFKTFPSQISNGIGHAIAFRECFPVSSGHLIYDDATQTLNLSYGQNITSITKLLPGVYSISFNTATLSDPLNLPFFCSYNPVSSYTLFIKTHINNGSLIIIFYTSGDNWTIPTDAVNTFEFNFMIFGA